MVIFLNTFRSLLSFTALPNPARNELSYPLYIGVHVLAMGLCLILLLLTLRKKPSRAQSAVVMFILGGIVYIVGFIEEILAYTSEGFFISCITQFLGELIVFAAAVFFVSKLCSVHVPWDVYIAILLFSAFVLFSLFATRSGHWFYNSISVNRDNIIYRPELSRSFMFYAVVAYIFILTSWMIFVCIKDYIKASPIQRKRLLLILVGISFCWLPYVLTLTGLTGGFEIPAIGISLASICFYACFMKYGFFDSQVLGGSNALEHCNEGIIIVDSNYRLSYQNKKILNIFGVLTKGTYLKDNGLFKDIFEGNIVSFVKEGKVYETYVEPLLDSEYVLGYMLWVKDSTERHEAIKEIQKAAIHDGLTGLYNRAHFVNLVEEDLKYKQFGTFVIFDMDNFKLVNDTYGHQVGDNVLITFSDVLKKYGEQRLYSCRLGGDEFCVYIRNTDDIEDVKVILNKIFTFFDEEMKKNGFENYTSLSAGAKIATIDSNAHNLYSEADNQLYRAKTSGKNQFFIAE